MRKVAADIFFVTYMLRRFIKIAVIQKLHQQQKISYLDKMPTFEILTLIGKKGGGMSFARTHIFIAITVQHLRGTANGKQTLLF